MPLPERELIARIRRAAERAAAQKPASPSLKRRSAGLAGVALGIGDDCAVLRPRAGNEIVVTTDLSLEGTHFRREWHPADSVGHRCLARGLSDIAAMGAKPMAAFLSLALPALTPQKWVDGFLRGLLRLAREHAVTLAGGDVARAATGGIAADIFAVGEVARGKSLRRSGARAGDIIYVTGALGGAAATLRRIFAGERVAASRSGSVARHSYPQPRLAAGAELSRWATSMIDLSDGLSVDLQHICASSGVGAVVNSLLLPVAPGAKLEDALHGGEDYELLFTAPARARLPLRVAGVPVTEIGWITRERGVRVTDVKSTRPLKAKGWEHFRR